ncbi:hypothetical protein ACFXTI_027340 [Malus domestica]
MVSDLIDLSSNSWRTEMISDGFNQVDVLLILSIPLSQVGIDDRLVWHHTTDGVYSVKTWYGLAIKLMEDGVLGRKGRGAPSDFNKLNLVWNNIWRLKVPNKIKIFIWRYCNNALAVRRNLKLWHMRIDNLGKIFKNRDNADEICQDFAFGLWRLWKNRNEVVFNGIHRQPLEILETWRKSITEYRASEAPEPADNCLRVTKPITDSGKTSGMWQKPRYGTIKINTDAAWCKNTMRMGVGWLGCDFAGLLQAAGGSGIGYCHSAAVAEATAIRAALMACIDHGFDDVIIESDARMIILMLKKEVLIDFSIECILGDIEILAQKLMSVSFAFVSREGNRAAYSVAKYVFKEGRSFTWDCIGPAFLFNFLTQDVNISIRL